MPNYRHIIEQAYQEILGRGSDPGGASHWQSQMDAGLKEAELREILIRSQEFATKNPSGVGVDPPIDPPPPPPPPGGELTAPIRAIFYYSWFPETWSVNGVPVSFHPTLGRYDSSNPAVVDAHIRAIDYGKIQLGIASWWGQGQQHEDVRIPLLFDRTRALGSPLRWALYYEKEGFGDPTVTQIQNDLAYIREHYVSRPAYAHFQGKPVLFVYNADDAECSVAKTWREAGGADWHLVLKVFSAYLACHDQPSAWHQYGPSVGELGGDNSGDSYVISPGYWQADEGQPRLGRDPVAWQNRVRNMIASNETWQLITTFNEWGEGTAVESAAEWTSPSGFGPYLDALHNDGRQLVPSFTRIVALAYREILDRDPDPSGLSHFNRLMQEGLTEASLRESLLRSPEFASRFPDAEPPPPPPPLPGTMEPFRVEGNRFATSSGPLHLQALHPPECPQHRSTRSCRS